MRKDFLEWMNEENLSARDHYRQVQQRNSRQLTDEDLAAMQDAQEYAKRNGLEPLNKAGYYHIFYDPKEGKYYDRRSDMYLTYDDARQMGIAT